MAVKETNKLIPILVGGFVLVVIVLLLKSNNSEPVEPAPKQEEISAVDADSTNATLLTLTSEIKNFREENQQLQTDMEVFKEQIKEKTESLPKDDDGAKIEELTSSYEQLLNDALATNNANQANNATFELEPEFPEPENEWIEPVNEVAYYETLSDTDRAQMQLPDGAVPVLPSSVFGQTLAEVEENTVGDFMTDDSQTGEESTLTPVYTIPRNSTLIGSTAMTALLGRVPLKGVVEDPYPVKFLVGKDNLAANGLEIPEVNHIVFTGTATGDWTLSCVRADLTSMTYVFEDGTIRTITEGDESLTKSKASSSQSAKRIAWISDNRGVPCVTGKRISNGTQHLLLNMLAQGVEAGAKATADAETTTTVNDFTGTATENVTGDALKNAGFETLAGGASAASEWLKERQAQEFDIIYAETGVDVAIHIDAELQIDYDTNGRKLNHGNYNQAHINYTLD